MPRRTVLSAAQRTSFEALPIDAAELARYYTLSESDLALIGKRRQPRNRLGYAIQLCLMRYPSRRLRADEAVPNELLSFVAEQIDVPASSFSEYARREETRREHFLELALTLQMKGFTRAHFRELSRWLTPTAVENPNSVFLMGAALNELRRRRILHPAIVVIERIVAITAAHADKRIFSLINSRLTDAHRSRLDDWLTVEDGQARSRLARVRQPIGRPCPANVIDILDRLDVIRACELPGSVLEDLPVTRCDRLVREGNRIAVHNLRLFSDIRRHAVMAVALLETHRSLIDEAITMHDRIVGGLMRRSKRKHAQELQDEAKRIRLAIDALATLGRALLNAKKAGQNAWHAIEQVTTWDELQTTTEEAEALSGPRKLNHLYFVDAQYPQIRRYAPALLEHFDFQSAAGGKDVLEALDLLREMNASGKRNLPPDPPVSFITGQWAPFIYQDDGIDRRYYELCALSELRNRLRSGDVWVPGSKQYQDFEGYLLGKTAFEELHHDDALPVAVETDRATYLRDRTTLLGDRLDEVHRLIECGQLEAVDIKEGRFSVSPHRASPIPTEARAFLQEVYAQLPRIKITDLLVEVDSWTGFTEQFTHIRADRTTDDKQSLLTVILSDGINMGLTRMAQACQGSSFKQLSWTADWYVTEEAYSRSLAELVNHHHRMALVRHWGDGTTSSSDGQQFPLGSIARPLGDVNPKYGSRPGVIFYTHVSDQYSPFHTKLINTNTRDATYVLDGLLYHSSELHIDEHYTDTAGFTDHVFGLCHLLGFRFAPRLRDVGDLSLFAIGNTQRWPRFEGLFGQRIRMREIDAQWDDILRLASSIRLGTVTASLIIRKLASYPRQNRLALAMRELGRIERTLFILDWMQDPALRARVQAGLNKGEARNALARAVFFNRLGEVRDRSFENQCYRASGLNLVVAAIVLWNTIYLQKALEAAYATRDVPDEYLAYLSPLGWEHINLTGDYVWRLGA